MFCCDSADIATISTGVILLFSFQTLCEQLIIDIIYPSTFWTSGESQITSVCCWEPSVTVLIVLVFTEIFQATVSLLSQPGRRTIPGTPAIDHFSVGILSWGWKTVRTSPSRVFPDCQCIQQSIWLGRRRLLSCRLCSVPSWKLHLW